MTSLPTDLAPPLGPRRPPRRREREKQGAVSGTTRALTALRVSAWSAFLLVLAVGSGVLLFLHRGDAEGSARLANAELEFMLERGESIERRAPVMQRKWWDYFRITHGVLAATDRRLLYVGVPPERLLPREAEPQLLVDAEFPFDRPVRVRRGRVFLGTRVGVTLIGESVGETYGIISRDRPKLDSVLGIVTTRQAALSAALEAERRAAEATLAAARAPIYHLVQRGEALTVIAERYGVSVDSILRWNSLPTDRITAGRRLLVKPGS